MQLFHHTSISVFLLLSVEKAESTMPAIFLLRLALLPLVCKPRTGTHSTNKKNTKGENQILTDQRVLESGTRKIEES